MEQQTNLFDEIIWKKTFQIEGQEHLELRDE